ncbi:MAG TPA: response regulator [Casimicrobiaceae bacterium]|nr:response regulator [Casimicrobiaceae bacterium]
MSPKAQAAPSGGTRELSAPHRTILVVDDEDALLRVLALVLEEEGYRVVTACNGRLALEAFATHGADLVITDYMMPEMDGKELVAALHEMRPRLPVIVMSSLDAAIAGAACAGHAQFVRKPFDIPDFLRSVAQLAAATGRDHLRLVK